MTGEPRLPRTCCCCVMAFISDQQQQTMTDRNSHDEATNPTIPTRFAASGRCVRINSVTPSEGMVSTDQAKNFIPTVVDMLVVKRVMSFASRTKRRSYLHVKRDGTRRDGRRAEVPAVIVSSFRGDPLAFWEEGRPC